jgi:hypothetical protein
MRGVTWSEKENKSGYSEWLVPTSGQGLKFVKGITSASSLWRDLGSLILPTGLLERCGARAAVWGG